MSYSKMYIAILDEAPDYMVPTLVAHSVINAHRFFTSDWRDQVDYNTYEKWLENSYRKVVVKVSRKEFDKIRSTLLCWEGHENSICNAQPSCLVCLPVNADKIPNVLKFAKMWKPS